MPTLDRITLALLGREIGDGVSIDADLPSLGAPALGVALAVGGDGGEEGGIVGC